MDGEVRIGMVGAGMVGQLAHLANFIQVRGCRVTALAELRPRLGALAADRFGVPQVFASHRDMLAADAVDAVVVVTRRPATGPVALEAMEAGKHVLSEKPMAHTVEQARRLVGAARARHLIYAVGFMKRHDAGTAEAKRMLDGLLASGELGRILLLRAWCFGGEFACGADGFVMTDEDRPDGLELWPAAPDWIPRDMRDDYAQFLNVFVHDLNLIRLFAGGTPMVRAVDLDRRNGRVVLFDCGQFPAVLEMSEQTSTAWNEGLEIVLERGRLSLAFPSPLLKNQPAAVTLLRGGEIVKVPTGWSWSFRRQAEAFVADIAKGREPLASGADSVADLELAESIWRCHLGLESP
jgi:predicted dehydrogenase